MSFRKSETPSTLTKMRQVYWEAKQTFSKSMGQREDSHIISSDASLDIRIELLQTADNYFNTLMRVLIKYRRSLQDLMETQDNLGVALVEFGTSDSTAAGRVMHMSGSTICKAAHRQLQLMTSLEHLYCEVETFQCKATTDALETVSKMEKVRRSYRSGLMWLKKVSSDLDPEANRKLKNYRKVQEHIKHLKAIFDDVKLECMQKIDLFLLSRSNLFSHSMIPYTKAFKKVVRHSVHCMDMSIKNIPLCLSYKFVAAKELNQYSEHMKASFEKQLGSSGRLVRRNMRSAGKTRSTDKNPSLSSESKNSKDKIPLPHSIGAGDALSLIDLNEDKAAIPSLRNTQLGKDNPQFSSTYSNDLLSINLEDSIPSFGNDYSMANFDGALFNSPSQETVSDENDLQFWSLFGKVDWTSEPLKRKGKKTNNSWPIFPKQVQGVSESKWNDILKEFDPFLDEALKVKDTKSGSLELC